MGKERCPDNRSPLAHLSQTEIDDIYALARAKRMLKQQGIETEGFPDVIILLKAKGFIFGKWGDEEYPADGSII